MKNRNPSKANRLLDKSKINRLIEEHRHQKKVFNIPDTGIIIDGADHIATVQIAT